MVALTAPILLTVTTMKTLEFNALEIQSVRFVCALLVTLKVSIYILIYVGMCENENIRLVGGQTMFEGQVQVCWNETWGTVCDITSGSNDAMVACKHHDKFLRFLDFYIDPSL